MESKGLYIVKEGTRNAFWQYEFTEGFGVKFTFGRLGLKKESLSPPTIKTFMSSGQRDREVNKKIAEKLEKGYKLVSQEEYDREQGTAQSLGAQFKIQRMEFVSSQLLKQFTFGKEWIPDCGVVVEIINSWTKEIYHLYLTKTASFRLRGCVMTPAGASITEMMQSGAGDTWAQAIRKLLKDTAQAVAKIVTQRFATSGTRSLDLGVDTDENSAEMQSVVAESMQSVGSGIGEQVLFKFASLGCRQLEL